MDYSYDSLITVDLIKLSNLFDRAKIHKMGHFMVGFNGNNYHTYNHLFFLDEFTVLNYLTHD